MSGVVVPHSQAIAASQAAVAWLCGWLQWRSCVAGWSEVWLASVERLVEANLPESALHSLVLEGARGNSNYRAA